MSKYYTTVCYMSGHTKKIDALNEVLRKCEDVLITSDGNKDVAQNSLREEMRKLNFAYPRCKDFTVNIWKNEHSHMEHFSIRGAGENGASVVFHKIKAEI